jgi:hypothetical protein
MLFDGPAGIEDNGGGVVFLGIDTEYPFSCAISVGWGPKSSGSASSSFLFPLLFSSCRASLDGLELFSPQLSKRLRNGILGDVGWEGREIVCGVPGCGVVGWLWTGG